MKGTQDLKGCQASGAESRREGVLPWLPPLELCPAPIPEARSPQVQGTPVEPGVLRGSSPPPPTHN